ncbi:putative regulatory protein [Pseudooceanicola batsensis HTCC2597]|uniref:Putative regulatory protein n=1 Tax=Pseudooceanicola batsensis (strain ATCC BAA-863 / DSM 15984 / KCTC 12145 / HTCC2597) TaxID=252305 RepID=A3U0K7_PSEBH|nr:substrate-binding domain-containing protein [Pseudooceanicola batsensis]EAQ02298.1 putative regulatory protein [Pseudooceanicola batsensis HTCC2597]
MSANVIAMPLELADFRSGGLRPRTDAFRVALLIPMCGSAGIWGPSCISSAQVAVEELNRANGIDGRPVQLIMIDAAFEAAEPIEEIVNDLIELGAIDAIVGMHISAIRQRLSKVVRQRVPYIYTPLYEGGETTAGLFAIGETPQEQLGPAIARLQKTHSPRKWALIGNDYVWPRASHSYAKSYLKSYDVDVVMERYLPFGLPCMKTVLEELDASGADTVLVSLVGQDAVNFNRMFGRMELHRKIVRLSCAMEENGLMACGAGNLERLFAVSSYFGGLATECNAAFKERYHALHGDFAPTLNALGQSTYEGMHYLAAMLLDHGDLWRTCSTGNAPAVRYASGRRTSHRPGAERPSVYLARADGLRFSDFKPL